MVLITSLLLIQMRVCVFFREWKYNNTNNKVKKAPIRSNEKIKIEIK